MNRSERRAGPPSPQLELPFVAPQPLSVRESDLTAQAAQVLHSLGAQALAQRVRVVWNARLRSCAGRADYRAALVTLNPRLAEHGPAEIDRTLRHELAHLLAQARAGRRRIAPHGEEWRTACSDLGVADERRCHDLPFPVRRLVRRFLYRCSHCGAEFPRVRRIRGARACGICCRRHNRGRFDARFRLQLCN